MERPLMFAINTTFFKLKKKLEDLNIQRKFHKFVNVIKMLLEHIFVSWVCCNAE